MTAEAYEATVHRALQRDYAPLRNASKLLSRLTGRSPRTCENWLAKLHAPDGAAVISLMRANDRLRDELLGLDGAE